MITLEHDALVFAFPEVHPAAVLRIEFQRTLRIPDDGRDYPLPPGLGRFPLRHVDDFGGRVPGAWGEHGGVMLPMYQAEALWLNFESEGADGWQPYRFAVKIATGKVSAVTGEAWRDGLHRDPQDYLVVPEQPWLDGYCVERGIIRQFVAMPLGDGYTVEEQLTGAGQQGGIQILVHPMKREVYERRFRRREHLANVMCCESRAYSPAMGLAPGGRMRQQIYRDRYDLSDWDQRQSSRCFIHIANSVTWKAITNERPPTKPMTPQDYTKAGLPWFDYYVADLQALPTTLPLAGLQGLTKMTAEKGKPLPENEPVDPQFVIPLGATGENRQVREGKF
jgi:hypothetical protein